MATLAELKNSPALAGQAPIPVGMDTVQGFEALQRVANLFASSGIVPKSYQGSIANCVIAVDMAMRMRANPLMVMQNLYIVYGNPAWSAQFLIATFNMCGRFSAIRYQFTGDPDSDDWGCRAVATELATGEVLEGPLVTIGLAKKEGWYDKRDKSGAAASKWPTMPEQMLRYRAAAWMIRVYAPEIAMGLKTAEELHDIGAEDVANSATTEDIIARVDDVPEQAEQQTEGTEEAEESAGMITCPATGKQVDELDCPSCHDRRGCPAWE